jgi:hypothetical protein
MVGGKRAAKPGKNKIEVIILRLNLYSQRSKVIG